MADAVALVGWFLAVVAIAVAAWQLKLQRDAMNQNDRLNALLHLARLVQDKIGHHEQIIENMKRRNQDWTGHARRVNKELRPLLQQVNAELLSAISTARINLDLDDLRLALRLSGEASESPVHPRSDA